MALARLGLVLGGLTAFMVGGVSWGQAQPSPDPIDQALQSAAPSAGKSPAVKLKPREDSGAAPDNGPAASATEIPPPDEDNPEADSAAPSSKSAAAKPAEPLKRPRYAVAVIQALDKVTAETVRFEVPVSENQPVRYKSLIFVVRACETTAPDEAESDAIAHVEIDNQPKGPDGAPPPPSRRVFRGWMSAASPGLNLFQHPIYDAWLIACKTASPAA